MLAPLQYQYPSPFAISAPQKEQRSVCRLRVSLVLCNCFLLSILQNSGGLSSLRRQNEKMVGKSKISC